MYFYYVSAVMVSKDMFYDICGRNVFCNAHRHLKDNIIATSDDQE